MSKRLGGIIIGCKDKKTSSWHFNGCASAYIRICAVLKKPYEPIHKKPWDLAVSWCRGVWVVSVSDGGRIGLANRNINTDR